MVKGKRIYTKRILAALLTAFMLFSLLPFQAIAANPDHSDWGVTITVTDGTGAPITGAEISYTIHSDSAAFDGSDSISDTVTTDETGCVEILKKDQYVADDLTISSAAVSKEGFTYAQGFGVIKDAPITSDDQNIEIQMRSTSIEGVVITPASDLVYNDGRPLTLVTVSGAQNGDTVITQVNDEEQIERKVRGNQSVRVEKTDAGSYQVKVSVQREGYDSIDEEYTVEIARKVRTITLIGKELAYNEKQQNLVDMPAGIQRDDTVTWYVDGNEVSVDGNRVPTAQDVGEYRVRLHIEPSNSNYVVQVNDGENEEVVTKIGLANLDLKGLKITPNELTYNGTEQAALTVSGQGNYILQYTFDEANPWTTLTEDAFPKVKDAGEYTVYVKATREGYTEASYETYPIKVTVKKAPQELKFANKVPEEIVLKEDEENNIYDFSAEGENLSLKAIQYSLADSSPENIASIDSNGKLKVQKPGAITVKALRPGTENYADAELYATVIVKPSKEELIRFEHSVVNSFLVNGELLSNQKAIKTYPDDDEGKLTYSIEEDGIEGISINADTGEVLADPRTLNRVLKENNNSLSVTVKVEKAEVKVENTVMEVRYDLFPFIYWVPKTETTIIYKADSATYTLNISCVEAPEFEEACEVNPPANNGWYNEENPPVVKGKKTPASSEHPVNYLVSLDPDGPFEESVTIANEGKTHDIYIMDVVSGYYFTHCSVELKYDRTAPDVNKMKISYDESEGSGFVQWVKNLFGFFNPTVKIIFEASDQKSDLNEDEISGLEYLNWAYSREEGASKNNLENETGRLEFDENGKAELTLTAEEAKQYRGHLSFTATDIAGNTSASKTDTDHVIVVDTIAPECEISYMDPVRTVEETVDGESQKRHYFSEDVELKVTVSENNFEAEDFKLTISKDGGAEESKQLTWTHPADTDPKAADNVYIGTYLLEGDGDYHFTANYTDKANNQSEPYSSDRLIVDKTSPILTCKYVAPDPYDIRKGQETVFTVKEHNFDPEGFEAAILAVDLDGKSVEPNDLTQELRNAEWTPVAGEPDTYTYTTSNYKDGIYDLKLTYTDPAKNTAIYPAEETETMQFVIDHSTPVDTAISYSKSIVDVLLNNITLGFYNPTVIVTFSATDPYSGIDRFTWSYEKESGASNTNVPAYENHVLEKEQIKRNGSVFTASIELPLQEAEQLRGNISVKATDTYGNTCDRLSDTGTTIIVDTVSPQMTVEYSKESLVEGYQAPNNNIDLYYGLDVDATAKLTLNVTEANFFSEDVLVSVDKNGEPIGQLSPQWTDTSVDDHTGVLSLNGDGHYMVLIDYSDKSTNKMNSFVSKTITLDSIKPVIEVTYKEKNPTSVLTDQQGHQRQYFDRVQEATVTIVEHNFDKNLVNLDIVGTDVTGAKLNTDQLVRKSEWRDDGDIHRITLTYSGDANYTFDVSCTDLANNKSDDYTPDYFTVDTVNPVVTSVSYSPSVLETVLAGISFGFYNSKATVTVTATDDTAGVHQFDYSYLTAAGVSAVNSQLLNQAIEEARINYSNGGRTATMTFEIPSGILGGSNQFNGTISFDAIDRSKNKIEREENKRIVVDNIAPTANVTLNAPVAVVGGTHYYDGNISGTISITEANFYPEDVVVMISRNGGGMQTLPTNWSNNSVDVHVGTFTLTDDGDYVINISYKDKSGNAMANYTSEKLTIDTKIDSPTIRINNSPKSGDNGGAYNNNINVSFQFADQNLDTYKIKLTRTRFDKTEDVTNQYIKVNGSGNGGSGSFSIPKKVENDGIYLLTISMSDKAKHSAESHVRFTANRFGSVYSYDDYFCSLIKDGGQYVKLNGDEAVSQDLHITEYNADRIVGDSLKILITRDGEPIDAEYTSKQDTSSDWYKYVYSISKKNFEEDGVYKITISSEDATGNISTSVPENSMDSKGGKILDIMTFTVDTVAPEIRNVINLENAIADINSIIDGKLTVKYSLVDVGGLAKAEVYLNGVLVDTIENFDNLNSYSSSFDISESDDRQSVRLVVTDLAGNVTDTASESFNPGDRYVFKDTVIVSTDFFVRWYRNAPAFWGTIGGLGAAGALGLGLAANKRRKKEKASA